MVAIGNTILSIRFVCFFVILFQDGALLLNCSIWNIGAQRRTTTVDTQELEEAPIKRAGKRNDPSYTKVTAYIPKELHKKTKMALLEEEKEFSLLIEELLETWAKKHT